MSIKRYISLDGSNKGVVTGYEKRCPQRHLDDNFEGILPYGCFFKNMNCGNNAKTIFGKTSCTYCQNNAIQVFEQSNDCVLSKNNIWPLQKDE